MNENKPHRTRRRNYSNKSDPNVSVQEKSLLENENNVKETTFMQEVKNDNENNFPRNFKKYFVSKLKFKKKNLKESVDDDSFEDFQNDDQTKQNSNRPVERNFYQQNLYAWKPLLTPKFVINLFLICSIVFLPLGIILYFNSNNIYEAKYDYTDCLDSKNQSFTCHKQILVNISYHCICRIYFYEENFQNETLYVYYMLENYFQNIRQYVKSGDISQFYENDLNNNLAMECSSLKNHKSQKKKEKIDKKNEPCGAIANSVFNDTFKIFYINEHSNKSIKLNVSKANLAWDTDRKYKFSNLFNSSASNPIKNRILNLSKKHNVEDLMVWMRTAAFPSFRKLYGRILLEENQQLAHQLDNTNALINYFWKKFEKNDSSSLLMNRSDFEKKLSNFFKPEPIRIMKLPKGNYFIDIDYSIKTYKYNFYLFDFKGYMVKQFDGRKYIILANVSWLGGKCYFLAWAYIIVGLLSFFASFFLLLLHVYYGNMHYNTAILLVDSKTRLVK